MVDKEAQEKIEHILIDIWQDGYDCPRREFKEGKLPIERIQEFGAQILSLIPCKDKPPIGDQEGMKEIVDEVHSDEVFVINLGPYR